MNIHRFDSHDDKYLEDSKLSYLTKSKLHVKLCACLSCFTLTLGCDKVQSS